VLAPMQGVNSEGFWEDRETVELNEVLLHASGVEWYSLQATSQLASFDAGLYQRGREILIRGFGAGRVEVVKDPRLCFTLPFWLRLCNELGVTAKVCVIERDITEVALSLAKRDMLPLGYCIALANTYRQHIDRLALSGDSLFRTTFDQLLSSPASVISQIIHELSLPLEVDVDSLVSVIKPSLRHQSARGVEDNIASTEQEQLRQMVCAFVTRGQQLTDIGEEHTQALDILVERDTQLLAVQAELSRLGIGHARALDTLVERDTQLVGVQGDLSRLGMEHSQALVTLRERDTQLLDVQQQLSELGVKHTHACDVVTERDEQLLSLHEQLQQSGEQHSYACNIVEQRDALIAELQGEVAELQNELTLHRSWKSKVLFTLGLKK